MNHMTVQHIIITLKFVENRSYKVSLIRVKSNLLLIFESKKFTDSS